MICNYTNKAIIKNALTQIIKHGYWNYLCKENEQEETENPGDNKVETLFVQMGELGKWVLEKTKLENVWEDINDGIIFL